MTVTFQHTRDELLKLIEKPDRRSSPTWPSTLYYYGVLPATFLVVALGASFGLAVIVLLLVYAGGAFTTYQQERLSRSGMLTETYLQLLLEPISISIDATGLRIQHSLYDCVYQWRAFSEMNRVGGYIRFQVSTTERFHIPTRAFASDADAVAFLDQAQQFASAATQKPPSDHHE